MLNGRGKKIGCPNIIVVRNNRLITQGLQETRTPTINKFIIDSRLYHSHLNTNNFSLSVYVLCLYT